MNAIAKTARKITVHYAASFAVYFMAFCTIRSFISVYLLDLGFSYTQIGLITGIHTFITAAIQPNFSAILDHFPRIGLRRFVAACCIPAVLSSAATFLLPRRMVFFIPVYIIFGICEIGLQSMMVSVGMEYVNAEIPINAGLARGTGSVGYAFANLILGLLIVRFGSAVSQKLNIGLMLLLALMMVTLPDPKEIGKVSDAEKTGEENHPEKLLLFLKNNPAFTLFALSSIFLFFGHSIVNTYMPNVAGQFGLGSDFTGAMNALAACLELIPMMFYTQISKYISPMKLLKISAVFFFIKILTAALARNAAGLAVSQSMQILAYALFTMSSIYFANQAVRPHNRVMAQGLLIGSGEAGFMLGGLIGGIVLDHLSIRALLWMAVIVSMIGSALLLISIRKFTE